MSEAWDYFNQLQDAMRARDLAQHAEYGWTVTRPTDCHTIGDLMGAIMSIDNDDDARRFFDGHVEDIERQIAAGTWQGRQDAETSARMNIGWCYGEGMAPDRSAMWRRVANAEHPGLPIGR